MFTANLSVCVLPPQEIDSKIVWWKKKFAHGVAAHKCAAALGISRATFFRYISKDVMSRPRLGAPTLLSPLLEKELVLMLIRCADAVMGFTKTTFRRWIKEAVAKVTSGRSSFLASEGWLEDFLKRHPLLKLRVARKILPERLDAWTEDIAARFFGQVKCVAKEYGPESTVNMDEAGLEFNEAKKLVRSFLPCFMLL